MRPATAAENTDAKPSPERSRVVAGLPPGLGGATSVPSPGRTEKLADRVSTGLESMSFG